MRVMAIRLFAALALTCVASSSLAAPEPMGACCNGLFGCCPPLGDCSITTQEGCVSSYQGDGSNCSCETTTTTIPPTTGACCTAEECFDVAEDECNPGTFYGLGNACVDVRCPDATTTTTLPLVVICGDANFDEEITATDALIALMAAVGTKNCALEVCDYNGSGEVTSSDALLILKRAVGQVVAPMCPIVA